jgi:hypothetical protein
MDTKAHGEEAYTTKAAETVIWYRWHPENSLALIERGTASGVTSV